MKRKYITVSKTIPASTSTTLSTDKMLCDVDYDRVVGVMVYEAKNASSDKFRIKTNYGGDTLQDSTFMNDYIPSTAVAMEDRIKKFNVRTGLQMHFDITPVAATAAEVILDFVIVLEKDEHNG